MPGMDSNPPRIIIRLEGPREEGGHLRLEDFLNALEEWKKILNQVDAIESPDNKAEVYYRVVNLSHSSPATIELEPVVRPRKEKKPKKNQAAPTKRIPEIERRPKRLLSELQSIKEDSEVSDEVDPQVLISLRAVSPSASNGIAKSSVIYEGASVDLDQKFSSNVTKMIAAESVDHGSMDGRLETLNLHGIRAFSCYIYPPMGPKKVRCTFGLHLRAKVLALADKYVRVHGSMRYRANSDFPYLMHLDDIDELPPASAIKLSEMSIPGLLGTPSQDGLEDDW